VLQYAALYPHDLDILYETLAHNSTMVSKTKDLSVLAKMDMETTVKRGQNRQDDRDRGGWKATLVRKTRKELGVPMTEACIFMAEVCTLVCAHLCA
jgi:hypothetical protein